MTIDLNTAIEMHDDGRSYAFVAERFNLDREADVREIGRIVNALEVLLVEHLNPVIGEIANEIRARGFEVSVAYFSQVAEMSIANPFGLPKNYGVGSVLSKNLGDVRFVFGSDLSTISHINYVFNGTPRKARGGDRSTSSLAVLRARARTELSMPTQADVDNYKAERAVAREDQARWEKNRQLAGLLTAEQTRELFELVLNSNIELPESLKPAFNKFLDTI